MFIKPFNIIQNKIQDLRVLSRHTINLCLPYEVVMASVCPVCKIQWIHKNMLSVASEGLQTMRLSSASNYAIETYLSGGVHTDHLLDWPSSNTYVQCKFFLHGRKYLGAVHPIA